MVQAALMLQALGHEGLRQWPEAERVWQRLAQSGPLAQRARQHLADLALRRKDVPEALAQLAAVPSWHVARDNATLQMARLELERGYTGPIYHSHAVANKEFLRVGGKAIEGARLAIAPVLVAEQLPDSHPNKAVGLALDKALSAKFGPDSRSSFAGASWDGWLVLEGALKSALASAKPGTPEFREAVRAGLEKTKVVGANGTYTMSADDHGGYDPKSAVLIEVADGKWKLVR